MATYLTFLKCITRAKIDKHFSLLLYNNIMRICRKSIIIIMNHFVFVLKIVQEKNVSTFFEKKYFTAEIFSFDYFTFRIKIALIENL